MMKINYRILRFWFVVAIALTMFSCGQSLSVEEETAIVDDGNPLNISLSFISNKPADAYIEYWQQGADKKSTSRISKNRISHTILLLGLLSENTYQYRVHLKNNQAEVIGEIKNFTTGTLSGHLPKFDVVTGNNTVFNGFLMLRKMDDPGTQIILNSAGKIVWYQVSDSAVFRPFWITSDTSYIALKATDEIVEMSIYGDTILYLTHNDLGFDKNLHHEIFKDSERHIVALTKEEKMFDMSAFGGSKEEVVVGDGILILDSSGTKLWRWNIFDAMDVVPALSLYRNRRDWSHANALSKDLDGNFLISFRNFSQIWKVDASDGHIIWKLGKGGDFELPKEDYFSMQHAVHVNPQGDIMLFDNIAVRGQTSRAIAFKIDDRKANVTLVVNLPDSLYSFKQGNVYFIDRDKLLFCSSMSNKIAITDLNGRILWQVNSDQSFYRVEYIANPNYFNTKLLPE